MHIKAKNTMREDESNLEIDKEAVKLLLTGATVEVLATGLQQDTDETDTKQMLRRIQHRWIAIYQSHHITSINL